MHPSYLLIVMMCCVAVPLQSTAQTPKKQAFNTAARHTCQADAPRTLCDCALEQLTRGVADPTAVTPDETTLLQTVQGCREVLGRGQWASLAEAVEAVQTRASDGTLSKLNAERVEADDAARALLEPVTTALADSPTWALQAWRWDAAASTLSFVHPEAGWTVGIELAWREDHVVIAAIRREERGAPVERGAPSPRSNDD